MNKADLKKEIDQAIGLTKDIYEDMVGVLIHIDIDSDAWNGVLSVVCRLFTLAWCLGRIGAEVCRHE